MSWSLSPPVVLIDVSLNDRHAGPVDPGAINDKPTGTRKQQCFRRRPPLPGKDDKQTGALSNGAAPRKPADKNADPASRIMQDRMGDAQQTGRDKWATREFMRVCEDIARKGKVICQPIPQLSPGPGCLRRLNWRLSPLLRLQMRGRRNGLDVVRAGRQTADCRSRPPTG